MERFSGAGVLVTGGAAGIGRAICEAFLAEGAQVAMLDVNEQRVREAAEALASLGPVTPLAYDVRDSAQVTEAVRKSEEILGEINILVNNAGVVTMSRVVDLSEEDWDFVMDVNAKGVFLMVRQTLPAMLRRGNGVIVNVASQAGKRGYPLTAHYCASKAAVIVFTKGVALEVAPVVRINCVCPGIVDTAMVEQECIWEEEITGEPQAEIRRRLLASIPMGRLQEPHQVAPLVLFLASDDASEITGQAMNVTGGLVME
jgi:meso-butanediol dehydrogenase/(S,S)-butanediol dehydrogenase/diacetyl reductase